MYFRKKTSGGRAYFQIVESHRDGAQVRQQVGTVSPSVLAVFRLMAISNLVGSRIGRSGEPTCAT
jgi:hypothetical protein